MYLQKQQQTFCQIIVGFFMKHVDLLQKRFHLRISRIFSGRLLPKCTAYLKSSEVRFELGDVMGGDVMGIRFFEVGNSDDWVSLGTCTADDDPVV